MSKRKLKKQLKNSLIIFDVSTCPKGWDLEMWWHFVNTQGLILWNSTNEIKYGTNTGQRINNPPKVININTRIKKLQVIDLKGKEYESI